MVKTFEEILKEEFNSEENYAITSGDIDEIEIFCLKLMKLVRTQTLIEAANKADADYYIFGNSDDEKRIESYDLSNVECYVLKESILQLNKNSIEI